MAAKYRAIRATYHRNFYYNVGDPYTPTHDELTTGVPDHFVKEREFSEDLVEQAEIENRARQIFVKPQKAEEAPA